MFRFKQFSVSDDQCAHPVGTDGVLLGAWARVEGCRRVLDIGTGSGLIALMVAQRCPQASVTGIDIDPSSVAQARENVARSPFASQIAIEECDVKDFHTEEPFDAILCNPPFFTETTLSPDHRRAQARHAALLPFPDLLGSVCRLLSVDGTFHVILPYQSANDFVNQAFMVGMNAIRQCQIRTVVRKPPRRMLLSFSRVGKVSLATEQLILQDGKGGRTEEYAELTRNFYL